MANIKKTCMYCKEEFFAIRSDKKFCSNTCRTRSHFREKEASLSGKNRLNIAEAENEMELALMEMDKKPLIERIGEAEFNRLREIFRKAGETLKNLDLD